ncbi:hypothetical protein SLA2020_111400 [Shorea laevis]
MHPESQRFSILLSSIFILLNLFLLHCYAAIYNITLSNPLSQNEILNSPAQVFELGLFCPDNTTNQYVGIWYKNIAPRIVVWVANRKNPVIDSLESLKIGSDGKLKLVDGNEVTPWSSNVSCKAYAYVKGIGCLLWSEVKRYARVLQWWGRSFHSSCILRIG